MTFYDHKQAVNTPSTLPKRTLENDIYLTWYVNIVILWSSCSVFVSKSIFSTKPAVFSWQSRKFWETYRRCLAFVQRKLHAPPVSAHLAKLAVSNYTGLFGQNLTQTQQRKIEIFIRIYGIKPSKRHWILALIEALDNKPTIYTVLTLKKSLILVEKDREIWPIWIETPARIVYIDAFLLIEKKKKSDVFLFIQVKKRQRTSAGFFRKQYRLNKTLVLTFYYSHRPWLWI